MNVAADTIAMCSATPTSGSSPLRTATDNRPDCSHGCLPCSGAVSCGPSGIGRQRLARANADESVSLQRALRTEPAHPQNDEACDQEEHGRTEDCNNVHRPILTRRTIRWCGGWTSASRVNQPSGCIRDGPPRAPGAVKLQASSATTASLVEAFASISSRVANAGRDGFSDHPVQGIEADCCEYDRKCKTCQGIAHEGMLSLRPPPAAEFCRRPSDKPSAAASISESLGRIRPWSSTQCSSDACRPTEQSMSRCSSCSWRPQQPR